MKITVLKFHTLLLCGALAFSACKKSKETVNNPPTDNSETAEATASTDHNDYLMISDQTSEEANVIVSGNSNTSGSGSGSGSLSLVIGLSVDSSHVSANSCFKLTYSGTSSAGYSRNGWDSIWVVGAGGLGHNWANINAYIIQKYDYTCTKPNGKTMRLVGRDTTWNIGGGNFFAMLTGSTQTTDHSGTATITFDDGTQRTWSHSRRKVRTYASGMITTTVSGKHSGSGSSTIDTWGTDRRGKTFYAEITNSLVWKYSSNSHSNNGSNTCAHWYDAISGVVTYKGTDDNTTITYGVDASGTATTNNNCPYGYKVNWVFQGQTGTKIYSY